MLDHHMTMTFVRTTIGQSASMGKIRVGEEIGSSIVSGTTRSTAGRGPHMARRRGCYLRCFGCVGTLFAVGFHLWRLPSSGINPWDPKDHGPSILVNLQGQTLVQERYKKEGLVTVQNYYNTTFTNQTKEMAQVALELTFQKERFLNNIHRWRRHGSASTEMNRTVLVLVTYPQLSAKAPPTYEPLLETVRDALSSPQAEVVVYLAPHLVQAAYELRRAFLDALAEGQLQILGENTHDNLQQRIAGPYPHLYNNLNFAYLLELAYQSRSDYTLFLRAGSQLVVAASNNNSNQSQNYASQAMEHYETIARNRSLDGDYSQTSWMWLSNTSSSVSPPTHLFLETSLHAHRLANVLRSSLPYNQLGSTSVLDQYRTALLWEATEEVGPYLFDYTKPLDQEFVSDSSDDTLGLPFVNASELLPLPPWMDSPDPMIMGPVFYPEPRDYYIAFGVNTLVRPQVGTAYLQEFLKDLLYMVQNEIANFTIPALHHPQKRIAVIVLLVGGHTLLDISSHRAFLETTYAQEIRDGWMELVDTPLAEYNATLVHRRNIIAVDSPERVFWRTKQNLDVAATLTAVAAIKSEFVMLLEDDTGFQQPNFTASLNSTLYAALADNHHQLVPTWSRVEYGFGYSGILLHYSDLHVFEQMHLTFADEMPCDVMGIYQFIKRKTNCIIRSQHNFPDNYRTDFLTHKGEYSTLSGKLQPVW